MKRLIWLGIPLAVVVAATTTEYDSVRKKLNTIKSDTLQPGARVELTQRELSAYAVREAPDGVRNPKVEVIAPGLAKGSADVDFLKLRRSLGYKPGWIMSQLLDGERPVSATARISSSNGTATVDVQSVTISGMEIDGGTLDFLIENVLLRMYPTAVVNRPFELGHRVERLDIQPRSVGVIIGK